jgi:hypothetical protein
MVWGVILSPFWLGKVVDLDSIGFRMLTVEHASWLIVP